MTEVLSSTDVSRRPRWWWRRSELGRVSPAAVAPTAVEGDRISAISRFDNSALPYFGLPGSLPADQGSPNTEE